MVAHSRLAACAVGWQLRGIETPFVARERPVSVLFVLPRRRLRDGGVSNRKAKSRESQPRCNICGRFVPKEGPWPCVYRDVRTPGGWEHK